MDEALLASFDSLEDSHWWFVARREIIGDLLRSSLSETPGDVLEVGCGTGGMLEDLARLWPNACVRGVEPSPVARSAARRRHCDVANGLFTELPAADESVDLLVALDVLEHCDSQAEALAEAFRVLRPGGNLLLTVPALPSLWSSHDVVNQHYRRYTSQALRDAVSGASFHLLRVTYFNMLLLPLGATARFLSRAVKSRGPVGADMPTEWLNRLLLNVFRAERRLLGHRDLPLGMSLMVLAVKPPPRD